MLSLFALFYLDSFVFIWLFCKQDIAKCHGRIFVKFSVETGIAMSIDDDEKQSVTC